MLHLEIHNCTIFIYDGAPYHKSRLVRKYLDSQHIKALDWPGNSHDLNPIENLWALINAKVSEKQPSSLEALQKVIKKVWVHEISPDYCLYLISVMPCRL